MASSEERNNVCFAKMEPPRVQLVKFIPASPYFVLYKMSVSD